MNKKQQEQFSQEQIKNLENARHSVGIYSARELCVMFNCSRYSLDNAMNLGKLEYISPNNRDRYIFLNDFIDYMKTAKSGD